MGHKVHPIGLRLGVHRKWKSNWYFDSKNFTKFLYLNFDIERYFKGIFFYYPIRTILINCQVIKMPSNEIFIFIFYYRLRKRKYKIKNTAWKIKRWRYNAIEKSLISNSKENAVLEYRIASSRKARLEKIINIISKYNSKNINKNFITCVLENNYNLKLEDYLTKLMFFKNYVSFYSIFSKLKRKKKKKLKVFLKKKKLKIFLKKIKSKIKLFKKSIILLNFLIIKLKIKFNPILNLYLKNLISKYNIRLNYYNKLNYIPFFCKKNNFFFKYYLKFFRKQFKKSILTKKKKVAYLKSNLKKAARLFLIKRKLNNSDTPQWRKESSSLFFHKKTKYSLKNTKKFLSKITNCKIHVIFINSLSFCKFVCFTNKKNIDKNKYNMWPLQRYFFNRYKYTAIYVKDFIHLAFITIYLKNPQILVNFIGKQFEDLPRNRRQIRLLIFVSHAIKVICAQRPEIIGVQFQIKGRLNRRTRTKVYKFREGILAIQSTKSRVEYGYSKGWTKRGSIGIRFWIFYKPDFNPKLRKKFLEYFLYSKYKSHFNFKFLLRKFYFWLFRYKKKPDKYTLMLQKKHNTTAERAHIREKFYKMFKIKSFDDMKKKWEKFMADNPRPAHLEQKGFNYNYKPGFSYPFPDAPISEKLKEFNRLYPPVNPSNNIYQNKKNFTPKNNYNQDKKNFIPRNNYNQDKKNFTPKNNYNQDKKNFTPKNNYNQDKKNFTPKNNYSQDKKNFTPKNNYSQDKKDFIPKNNYNQDKKDFTPKNNYNQDKKDFTPKNNYNNDKKKKNIKKNSQYSNDKENSLNINLDNINKNT